MKISERTLRISAASLLALLFVGSAYVLSGPSFLNSKTVNAESTEELLKEYASKDTDGDQLPDWQEALYGTDPRKTDTDGDGVSDGEAARTGKLTPNALASQLPNEATSTPLTAADLPGVDPAPGSVTEQFSREFLQEVVNASNGQQLTADQQQQIVATLFTKYSSKAGALFVSRYSTVSVHTNASVSVSTYAGQVENIFSAHDVSSDANQPLLLIEALIQNDDQSARPKIQKLADSYGAIATDLLALNVPPELATQHLALIQGFDTLHKATAAFVTYETDPLGVMGALSAYQPSSNQVLGAIKGIATVLISQGEPAAGEPGAMIVNIARSSEIQ